MSTKTTTICMVVGSVIAMGCGPSGRDLSDQQWLQLQSELQQERAEVGKQRDQLETDRREWDQRQRGDAVLAAVITSAGLLIACGLPLLVVVFLFWPRPVGSDHDDVVDVLLEQMATDAEATDRPKLEPPGEPAKLASRES